MTEHDPDSPRDALGRVNPRMAPDAVWERVREEYLAGTPAAEVCRRHGVALTSLRNRAAGEAWRRSDQPWTPPAGLDPQDEGLRLDEETGGDLDRIELRQLAFVADRRMMRAVLRGQAADALRWRRVRQMLAIDDAELQHEMDQDEAARLLRLCDGVQRPPVDSMD